MNIWMVLLIAYSLIIALWIGIIWDSVSTDKRLRKVEQELAGLKGELRGRKLIEKGKP